MSDIWAFSAKLHRPKLVFLQISHLAPTLEQNVDIIHYLHQILYIKCSMPFFDALRSSGPMQSGLVGTSPFGGETSPKLICVVDTRKKIAL